MNRRVVGRKLNCMNSGGVQETDIDQSQQLNTFRDHEVVKISRTDNTNEVDKVLDLVQWSTVMN